MGNWKLKCDEGKVKALRTRILEECERQSFTRHEFSKLLYLLQKSESLRREQFWDEPIIPPEGIQELI